MRPDGYLDWGSSPLGIVYYGSALGGRWDWPYEHSDKIFTDIMATTMPGPALRGLPVWDMNGTFDEVYSVSTMLAARNMMQPYVGKHVLIRIEGFNHSIVSRQVRVIGPIWLRAIDSGYFD
jgi:hypothetical protein